MGFAPRGFPFTERKRFAQFRSLSFFLFAPPITESPIREDNWRTRFTIERSCETISKRSLKDGCAIFISLLRLCTGHKRLINESSLAGEWLRPQSTSHGFYTTSLTARIYASRRWRSRGFTAAFPARKSKCTLSLTTCLFDVAGFSRAPRTEKRPA